ncbi:26S proteasome regulatory subunit [Coccomyxa subellipsoidea C-169]|uniref:26S proteasome regulatory subunit n=1 Tax=Coccomyxa subellipsoidea (strain C-169) TaxID=574566 RepID=I0Z1W8_COCSC|nr:26S proteasome regulatory subunit [Coccomyxa subellipsoidea C-169]EIE24637.1 26S proteasome regulatory subunit [Coccomyxa subellipsoidea C-169]|eukprot:XP_005649181.1 26S proteasome regulatory subunit [Coccomyxa subellipsoidea C-169]
MGKAIEMKDADAAPSDSTAARTEKKETAEQPPSVSAQLATNVSLLESAVRAKETRLLVGRLLRQTTAVRKQLTAENLADFVKNVLPRGYPGTSLLLTHLNKASSAMETDGTDAPAESAAASSAVGLLPELETYAYLLVVTFLVDKKLYPEAKEVVTAGISRVADFNRRTLDGLAARLYFYYSLVHEHTDTLADIRSHLLALHRTAVLRHDEYGQETLLNLLLRNYLHYNLYDQAEKLRSKAQRPEVSRSTQQLCRYLYYLGRIRAIQLDYTEAKDCLQQASRKAPSSAVGFRVEVSKWLSLVRLLLGEVPEHSEFTAAGLAKPLAPYFSIAQAVRAGDLVAFRQVADANAAVFAADKTQNLIVRLQYNVIRAGLRRINLAYSRISLADVATRLGLASVEDTECIVAKAIRDGGVDAVLDHANGWMLSKEVVDIYATAEPAAAFHARVAFCLDIHNEAVRAMRFDAAANTKKLETAESARERVIAEEELAKAYEEEEGI